jgi:hypothetical protein
MTDLMTRPRDTGEIRIPGDRTQLLRATGPVVPVADDPDGATRKLDPAVLDAAAFPHGSRRPVADTGTRLYRTGTDRPVPENTVLYRADADAPATIADVDQQRPVTSTTGPICRRLVIDGDEIAYAGPDDMAAAQPVGPLDRVLDDVQLRYTPATRRSFWARLAYRGGHRVARKAATR